MPAADSAPRNSARVAAGLVRTRPRGQTRPSVSISATPRDRSGPASAARGPPGRASAAGAATQAVADGATVTGTPRQDGKSPHGSAPSGPVGTTTRRDDDSSRGAI